MEVILYSTPTCPKCRVLEMKLQKLGYQVKRNYDAEEMKKLGISAVPYIKYGDEPLMDFSTALEWIKNQSA